MHLPLIPVVVSSILLLASACGTSDDLDSGAETSDAATASAETGSSAGDSQTAGDGDSTGDGDGDSTGDGDGDSTGDGDGDGTVGDPPSAVINHPGAADGPRVINVPIPFVGVATDTEDGPLSGASMVWTSDLEPGDGIIGTGEMFDAALTVLGVHTITLEATDSDTNVALATVAVPIVP